MARLENCLTWAFLSLAVIATGCDRMLGLCIKSSVKEGVFKNSDAAPTKEINEDPDPPLRQPIINSKFDFSVPQFGGYPDSEKAKKMP